MNASVISTPIDTTAGCLTSDQTNIYVAGGLDIINNENGETWIYSLVCTIYWFIDFIEQLTTNQPDTTQIH